MIVRDRIEQIHDIYKFLDEWISISHLTTKTNMGYSPILMILKKSEEVGWVEKKTSDKTANQHYKPSILYKITEQGRTFRQVSDAWNNG